MRAEAPVAGAAELSLSPQAFERVTRLFHEVSGIRLAPSKHSLVVMRLGKLAAEAGETGLDRYVDRLVRGELPASERVKLVDRLTTNETYFFREPQHFRHFAEWLEREPARRWQVWSGASSSGEEIYSLAMLMSDRLGLGEHPWRVLGTDLSTQMVQTARRAIYRLTRTEGIPPEYLKRYCLRGQGEHEGSLLIDRRLRERTKFESLNLMQPLPEGFGPFNAIWLRNVLIYFDNEAKSRIVKSVLGALAPHGLLYVGHSESLMNLNLPLRTVAPAVYTHAAGA